MTLKNESIEDLQIAIQKLHGCKSKWLKREIMNQCELCGGKINIIKDKSYKYDESGLDVVLYGIPQYKCVDCKETYASLPKIQHLHRLIGVEICTRKKALLTSREIKFLRKDLHQKAKDLGRILGVTASTISKWENNKKPIGEAHDRLLRSLYMMYASEQANHIFQFKDGIKDVYSWYCAQDI